MPVTARFDERPTRPRERTDISFIECLTCGYEPAGDVIPERCPRCHSCSTLRRLVRGGPHLHEYLTATTDAPGFAHAVDAGWPTVSTNRRNFRYDAGQPAHSERN
jgi:hypothetical protein